jgi:hypothetical protein
VFGIVRRPRLLWKVCLHFYRKATQFHQASGDPFRTAKFMFKYVRWAYAFRKSHKKALRSSPAVRRSITAATPQDSATPLLGFHISGGIGDYVVIARFLRDLAAAVEPFRFDLYAPDPKLAEWVFASVPGFHCAYSEFIFPEITDAYALTLRISQFVIVWTENADWWALRNYRALLRAMENITRFRSKIEIMVERHPYMDGFLAQKAVYMNLSRRNFLHGMAKIMYGGDLFDLAVDMSLRDQLDLSRQSYVTINNGFDQNFIVSGQTATKCYPHSEELVRQFKARFPRMPIVQIGAATSTPIESADINLINKSSIQQAAGLLSRSSLHIDNEGGLVHIARCFGVTSCVVFGPTSLDYFAYPDNINVRSNFCGGCWWIDQTWMEFCPRRFPTALCMSEQKPETIVDSIAAKWAPPLAPETAKQ